jgi:hypothetical protein
MAGGPDDELAAAEAELARVQADAGVTDVEVVRSRPLVAIVSSADVAAEGTLNADYWVHRRPAEGYPAFRRRKQAEDAERRAEAHERHAALLREEAAQLRGLDPGEVASDYQRGRVDMLREVAVMDAAERADLLSRWRHPSGGGG